MIDNLINQSRDAWRRRAKPNARRATNTRDTSLLASKHMPKRKAPPEASAASATGVPPYNPLRDRVKLEAAARDLASKMLASKEKKTAMAFCREVLQSMGLSDVAIGQSERIFISGIRKTALGENDVLTLKPGPAAPIMVPTLSAIATSLSTTESDSSISPSMDSGSHHGSSSLASKFDAAELIRNSLVHVEGFLSPSEVSTIARLLASGGASSEHATALRESSGTGRNGAYCHVTLAKVPPLARLKEELQRVLRARLPGCDADAGKVLVTRYGEGGVNYAHMDQSDFPYQAYLLLSRPSVDFDGGQLYLIDPAAAAEGAPAAVAQRTVQWKARGDLVIFAANGKEAANPPKNWLHGFRQVKAGSAGAEQCHMSVVGLLE